MVLVMYYSMKILRFEINVYSMTYERSINLAFDIS